MSEEPKTGPELVAEAAQEPTLDEYLRRDPATLSPKDIGQIVAISRKARAMFIANEAAKKAKKKGEEPDVADTQPDVGSGDGEPSEGGDA